MAPKSKGRCFKVRFELKSARSKRVVDRPGAICFEVAKNLSQRLQHSTSLKITLARVGNVDKTRIRDIVRREVHRSCRNNPFFKRFTTAKIVILL